MCYAQSNPTTIEYCTDDYLPFVPVCYLAGIQSVGTHVWNKAGLDSDVLDPVGVQVIVIPC